MTAEIAIFNRSAVVLAADSAVTISASGRRKSYRSDTKLFELSKHRPVAVMVFGSASIMGLPWDVIIGEYRQTLGDRGFDTLQEYAEDFFSSMGKHLSQLPNDAMEQEIGDQALAVCDEIREEAFNPETAEMLDELGPTRGRRRIIEELTDAIDVIKESLDDSRSFTPISDDVMAAIKKIRKDAVNHFLDETWLGHICTAGMRRRVHNAVQKALTEHARGYLPPHGSGVVIAGYGEKDLFPVVRAWSCTGLLTPDGPLRALTHASDLDPATNEPKRYAAGLLPFAQDDTMQMFMRGLSPGLYDQVGESLGLALEIVDRRVTGLIKREGYDLDGALERTLERAKKDAGAAFLENLFEEQDRWYVRPVTGMLDMLPPAELAHAAEALVSFQSLRQRMTMSVESVSAPVDVLMISKVDGLAWIKRKPLPNPGACR
jgi:hypothetical protein